VLLRGRLARDAVFYPLFALAASVAVPVLGLFLVFALLIAPALWQQAGLSTARALLLAAAAGGAGLALSWWLDAPSGACVTAALALLGLAAALAVRRCAPTGS
jgi:zinc/manganese transport system permease protein